jgi:hypothetical protein
VLNARLQYLKTRVEPEPVAPSTLEMRAYVINSFIAMHGDVAVRDLTDSHFQRWLHAMKQERPHPKTGKKVKWGRSTVRLAIKALRGAFKWARGPGKLVSVNPLDIHVPSSDSLGVRVAMLNAEYNAMVGFARR